MAVAKRSGDPSFKKEQRDMHDHASDMDMPAHVRTYGKVMTMLKWGAVGCFLVGAFVVWLIA